MFWMVASAALSPDGKTVTLTLESPLPIDTTFSVSVSNLTSSDGTPLVGSTTAQFQTWDNDPQGIKVFILAGQSNMVGYGHSENGNGGVAGAIGSLRHLAVNNASYPDYDYASLLVNPANPATSAWKTRGDVKAWWRDGGTSLGGTVRKGDLGPPFLGIDADQYGPEFGFGQILGNYYVSGDVLIIKAAWGGKSLAVDFRPPSAVARVPGTQVGPFYRGIFDNVRDVLANLGTEFTPWSGKGYQIVGFGWHQGWNDRVDQTYNDEYEANMKDFIDDVRAELGQPELPFVIATTGMNGWSETHPRALSLMNAQLAMANYTKYPAHEGNVDVIDTRDFWRDATVSPVDQGFHWNQNGETMFLIGKSMGDRMVNLLGTAP
jgi:alpha-galactosidase